MDDDLLVRLLPCLLLPLPRPPPLLFTTTIAPFGPGRCERHILGRRDAIAVRMCGNLENKQLYGKRE